MLSGPNLHPEMLPHHNKTPVELAGSYLYDSFI